LNFYECITEFEANHSKIIKFKCLLCSDKTLQSPIGRTTNLKRHLNDDHKKDLKLVDWLKRYYEFNTKAKAKAGLDDNMLDLIKYFILSNNSLTELKNKYFRRLMKKAKIQSPDYRTFVNGFLPELMQSLHEKILHKLTHAQSVSLITDIWTNNQMRDFIAVAASIIDEHFKKQVITIGFDRMTGSHCAVNVKIGVEKLLINIASINLKSMVNIQFLRPFKLTIIFLKGITVDEGSNMVRYLLKLKILLTLKNF